MKEARAHAMIDVFPTSSLGNVSDGLFSGFLEHLGSCIYGGILPATPTSFPYTSARPCPSVEFIETPTELLSPEGWRTDVMAVLRDELKMNVVRWPGGNYVSSYHWMDGIGPKEERKVRPELAWGAEESNQFGTDEYIAWCRAANIEPFIIFNMGDGTLQEALNWLEYCNGMGKTYYAELRRNNTGRDEPYSVKLWGLGNEVWGDWQVGQQSAPAYAEKAKQWAKALRLLDPTIKLVACGQSGRDAWDATVLDALADKVDYTSLHFYTGFGERDRSETDKEFGRSVYGPQAAERAITICESLIEQARIERNVTKPVKICFDEYGVWDETVGLPENGLRQTYNLTDALALASWLNVFLRHSSSVEIACLAQSVNVISPLSVSPTGVLRQTLFAPLKLYSDLVRGGEAVRTAVSGAGSYSGETLPRWIGAVSDATLEVIDVAAVLHPSIAGSPSRKLVLAVVNRSESDDIFAEVRVAFGFIAPDSEAQVHEIWDEDVKAVNDWKDLEHGGRERVHTKTTKEKLQAGKKGGFERVWKRHSIGVVVLDVIL